jgi:L-asparaginase II
VTDQVLFEVTRGNIVETVHYGSIAIVDSKGKLISSYGDPKTVAFLRSSAKPFQALPFVENGGVENFSLTPRELSVLCASHEGSDLHVQIVEGIQKKAGIDERNLQCGIHMPSDVEAFKSLILNGKEPTPNRNNCSGKHSGMLAKRMRSPAGKLSRPRTSHPAGYPCCVCRDVPASR